MIIISIFFTYHLLFLLIGLAILQDNSNRINNIPKNKFAVILPAHNEQSVIYDSVKSIFSCKYPKDLLDVYVIADNCSDGTAYNARKAGALVLERQNKTKLGKQHALDWAFKKIDLSQYDAVIIFDSDNRVDPGYLTEMDYQLQKGNKVIQGYVGTKNPTDSWVTANYAYMFWYLCRMQMTRNLIGLSCWLAGTGFCVSTEVLQRVGWKVQTLCDDMEYTAQLIIAGEKVSFASRAIFYDEKPVGLKDSLKQRLRWIRGQTQVTLRYLPKLAFKIVTAWWQGDIKAAARAFDGIMWIPMQLVVILSILYALVTTGSANLLQMIISVPLLMMLPMLAESIKNVKVWKYLITAGIFYWTWLPILFYGVATCGKKTWWRTPHGA